MNQKPLVSIEWSADGTRIAKLEVNPQISIQQIQPEAPHPAWKVADSLIRVGGLVGGIWAGGQAIEGIVESSRGITTTTVGGHMAGGDVSIPTTTTTTTTETSTNTETTDTSTETDTSTWNWRE